MEINKKILDDVAKAGANGTVDVLLKLFGITVTVEATKVEEVLLTKGIEMIKSSRKYPLVLNAQLLSGVEVPSELALILSHEHALALVGLLNRRAIGSIEILSDIERSALKEIFNIMSNLYVTSLSKYTSLDFTVGVPNLITVGRLVSILEKNTLGKVFIFTTKLSIFNNIIETRLYMVFS